jgi:hypothetical protein
MEVRLGNHCCSGKAINVIHSEILIVALVIQLALRMRHIVCGLSGCPIFFCIISQMARFSKNVTEREICFDFSLKLLSEIFLILRRTERDMIVNVLWSLCKVFVIF